MSVFAGVVIGFVPDQYSANEVDGFITFRMELLIGVLVEDVVVEFYTESGSAEGEANQPVDVVYMCSI